MSVTATIHQDDGNGHCTACGTVWPTECIAERHAVWIAETHDPSGMDEYHPDSSWNPGGNP